MLTLYIGLTLQMFCQNNPIINVLADLLVLFVIHGETIGQDDLVVQTRYGKVRGLANRYSKNFYGIPYALPPVGRLR